MSWDSSLERIDRRVMFTLTTDKKKEESAKKMQILVFKHVTETIAHISQTSSEAAQ